MRKRKIYENCGWEKEQQSHIGGKKVKRVNLLPSTKDRREMTQPCTHKIGHISKQ